MKSESSLSFPVCSTKFHRDFVGVCNKTIILLVLDGYEMIIANLALRTSLAPTISHPTRTRGIIVKYMACTPHFICPVIYAFL